MVYRTASVLSTVTQLWSWSPQRKSGSIFNNGSEAIFISQDRTVTTGRGFPIPAGGSVSLTEEEGDEPDMALYAIAAVGPVDVRIQEGGPENPIPPRDVKVVGGPAP